VRDEQADVREQNRWSCPWDASGKVPVDISRLQMAKEQTLLMLVVREVEVGFEMLQRILDQPAGPELPSCSELCGLADLFQQHSAQDRTVTSADDISARLYTISRSVICLKPVLPVSHAQEGHIARRVSKSASSHGSTHGGGEAGRERISHAFFHIFLIGATLFWQKLEMSLIKCTLRTPPRHQTVPTMDPNNTHNGNLSPPTSSNLSSALARGCCGNCVGAEKELRAEKRGAALCNLESRELEDRLASANGFLAALEVFSLEQNLDHAIRAAEALAMENAYLRRDLAARDYVERGRQETEVQNLRHDRGERTACRCQTESQETCQGRGENASCRSQTDAQDLRQLRGENAVCRHQMEARYLHQAR
jgi:hypothetical protein